MKLRTNIKRVLQDAQYLGTDEVIGMIAHAFIEWSSDWENLPELNERDASYVANEVRKAFGEGAE